MADLISRKDALKAIDPGHGDFHAGDYNAIAALPAADLHPDHILLLSLAEQAFRARDARELWRTNTRRAAADHGAACEALWDELGRQVAINDGRVPTLEHPTVTYRRKVAEWRREIVTCAQNAVVEALDALQDGPPIEDETWLPNAEDDV